MKNKWIIPFSPLVLKVRAWAFHRHDDFVNQFYDEELNLKYSYHLQMVADVAIRFSYLLDSPSQVEEALLLSYCHDILEDGRLTPNDLIKELGRDLTMKVISLSVDPRGLTKEDRLSDDYYSKINEDFVTAFIKLCDRIANVEQASLTNSIRPSYRDLSKIRKHFTHSKFEDLIDYLHSLTSI